MSNESANTSVENANVSLNANEQSKKTEAQRSISRLCNAINNECAAKTKANEQYLKCMQELRKEVTYINETEWMFESLDRRLT